MSLEIALREVTPQDLVHALQQSDASSKSSNGSSAEAVIEELSVDETNEIYSALPDIGSESNDVQEFFQREKTVKPAKTASIVKSAFPPTEVEEKPDVVAKEESDLETGDLQVLRYLPEGDVNGSVPYLSVTFSQSMVPLSTIDQIETLDIPVKISPQPEGSFAWIGTKTLQFKPKYRFPMSTAYTVTVDGSATSTNGKKLQKDFVFGFSTPTIALQNHYPYSNTTHPWNQFPYVYLEFDQRIDPQQVLPFVSVSKSLRTQLLTSAEVEQELNDTNVKRDQYETFINSISYLTKNAPAERHLWFKILGQIDLAQSVTISLNKGVPSLEGPLKSIKADSFSATNYGPLKLVPRPMQNIVPLQQWYIEFSNQLDLEAIDESIITVEPPLDQMKFDPSGNYIHIGGRSKGSTTYTVTINEKLQDIYGQQLSGPVSIEIPVGSAAQTLQAFQSRLIVLDPTSTENPQYSVASVNLKQLHVIISQVEATDYKSSIFQQHYYDPDLITIPGVKLLDQVVDVEYKEDEPVETTFDLTTYLKHQEEKLGHVFVFIQPVKSDWKGDWKYRPKIQTWIQVTRLCVDAFSVGGKVIAWSNSLIDGSTIPNTEFFYLSHSARTDTGVATFDEVNRNVSTPEPLIRVKSGNDTAFTTIYPSAPQQVEYVSKIFTDRNLYKPKETVNVKGFIRKLTREKDGTRSISIPQLTVQYKACDSRRQEISSGTVTLSEHGSFNISFALAENVNLGSNCFIAFTSTDPVIRAICMFCIQEFRTPEYKVSSSVPSGPFIVNNSTVATVSAGYYSGGGLNGADVFYTCNQSQASYNPPGWHKFSFIQKTSISPQIQSVSAQARFSGKTDSNGENQVAIEFKETDRINRGPVTISVQADVQDLNRQTINSSTSFIVHPSSLYVGAKSSKYFVRPNDTYPLELVVTTIAGKPIAQVPISLKAYLLSTKRTGYKYNTTEELVYDQTVISGLQPISHEIVFSNGGKHKIVCEIQDENGLTNSTELITYVFGGLVHTNPTRNIPVESVTLIADKETYQPDDVAEVFIQAPFTGPSEGLILLTAPGLVDTVKFEIKEGSCAQIRVPIKKEYVPSLSLNATITGQTILREDSDQKRPAYASGKLDLSISTLIYNLDVQVVPKDKLMTPGSSSQVEIRVNNSQGAPVTNSEVSLFVVDEAVLSLTNYSITNPLSTFFLPTYTHYQHVSVRSMISFKNWDAIAVSGVSTHTTTTASFSSFDNCMELSNALSAPVARTRSLASGKHGAPKMMMMMRSPSVDRDSAPQGGAAQVNATEDTPTFEMRSNFNPLAAFVANAKTDEDGKVVLEVSLPDSLTQYRVIAIAASDNACFGLGESSITAQLPVSIRPSLPRFLNFGDKADFSCILQNQSESQLEINVAARSTNLSFADVSKSGYKVHIPSLGRVELRFPMKTEQCGTARFQIGAVVKTTGVRFTDAVEKEIPVYTPATSEAFATYGEIDDDGAVVQAVVPPKNVWPQFGSLEINTSSTALSSLTDAFIYLLEYPFECMEQLASRLMSIIALKDVLYAFNVSTLPPQDQLSGLINSLLEKLYKAQNSNGSFSFWDSSSAEVSPFVTIHVSHCFARCKLAGIPVREENFERTLNILRNIESIIPAWYSQTCIASLKAKALFALALLKDQSVLQLANQLIKNDLQRLSMEGLAWVAFAKFVGNGERADASINSIVDDLLKKVNETAETANFVTSYGDRHASQLIMLHSNHRTDAIILEMLMTVRPNDNIIPKIVKGLLAHKKKGKWHSTQENVFALLALNSYFKKFEGKEPDFVAKAWLGEDYVGEYVFKGRTTEEKQIHIPMRYLINNDNSKELLLDKHGPGRMYYRLGISYAPRDLVSHPRDYGFFVSRTYESVTDESHVVKDSQTGVWRFKAGELVRVRITMSNTSRRYHVALVDKLPGGLEVLNPELKTTGAVPQDPQNKTTISRWWFSRTWYEHQNMRDERVEAFASLLWEGVHTYSFVCRATTIGEFVVPPTHAEEMYSPEIFGRSASDRVIISE